MWQNGVENYFIHYFCNPSNIDGRVYVYVCIWLGLGLVLGLGLGLVLGFGLGLGFAMIDTMYRSSWNSARMQNFTDMGETDGVPVYSNELASWDFKVFSFVIRSRYKNWTELSWS